MIRRAFMGVPDREPAEVRLGAVSYLNSRPLVEGLHQLLPGSEIRLDYPSRLADSLARRELDIALIPSIEYFRRPGYEIVSDACVAARGEGRKCVRPCASRSVVLSARRSLKSICPIPQLAQTA